MSASKKINIKKTNKSKVDLKIEYKKVKFLCDIYTNQSNVSLHSEQHFFTDSTVNLSA